MGRSGQHSIPASKDGKNATKTSTSNAWKVDPYNEIPLLFNNLLCIFYSEAVNQFNDIGCRAIEKSSKLPQLALWVPSVRPGTECRARH